MRIEKVDSPSSSHAGSSPHPLASSAASYAVATHLHGLVSTFSSLPIPTTQEVISSWFDEGKKQGATHMIIYTDTFSYGDYPRYVLAGEDPRKTLEDLQAEEMIQVREVYALHLDKEKQLKERRSWHLENAPFPS